MSKRKQWRRETSAFNETFTGALAEITVDTDTGGLRVHNGTTLGGSLVGNGINAQWFATIAAADTAAVARATHLRFVTGDYAVAANLAIASPVHMDPGAFLVPASGVTITLNGPFQAGTYQTFDLSSGGVVAFGIGAGISVRPEWFGARNDYDGSAPKRVDNGPAFQAAIDSMAAEGAIAGSIGWQLELTQGHYWFSSGFVVDRHRVHVVGKGRHASCLHFAPSAAATLIKFDLGASAELFEGGVRGVGFRGEGSEQKIAIDFVDVSDIDIDDIGIQAWTGNSGSSTTPSIGIRSQGRELVHINNVQISADRPIHVIGNPNHTIDCDFLHLSNTYLLPQDDDEYAITIDDGVNLQNLLIDGDNCWSLGKGGLYWVDTRTGAGFDTSSVRIDNVRMEQQVYSADGYAVRIERAATGSPIYSLSIKNFICANNLHGIRLRKVLYASLDTVQYTGGADATRNYLDVDTSCEHVELRNCAAHQDVTYSLGGMTLLWGFGQDGAEKVPAWAIFVTNIHTPIKTEMFRIQIADDETPSAAASSGALGTIQWDANYIYVCVAADTWKRAALATW